MIMIGCVTSAPSIQHDTWLCPKNGLNLSMVSPENLVAWM